MPLAFLLYGELREIARVIIDTPKRLYDAKHLQLDVSKTIYFFPCSIRKNERTWQLPDSLLGAADETKSEPEAAASVTF